MCKIVSYVAMDIKEKYLGEVTCIALPVGGDLNWDYFFLIVDISLRISANFGRFSGL